MASSLSPLPCPDNKLSTDVIIYDGECGICTAQVHKLPWWDCQQKLSYLSLHDPQVATRWPQLSADRLKEEMCLIDTQGRQHWGPDAIRYLSLRLRRLWWLAPILYLPGSMFLWRPLYRWMAKNRYRLSKTAACTTNACKKHH